MTTPRLTPFPLRGASTIIEDTFDAWASNGWTREDSYPDDFSSAWGANGAFAVAALFTFDGPHSTFLRKTYTQDDDGNDLPPNTLVVIRVGLSWSVGVGCPGGPSPGSVEFFGAEVNGVRGALPGPIFFDPSVRTITIVARTTSSGELAVGVGADQFNGSYDIAAGFATVSVTPIAAELADIFYDAGVLYIDGNGFSITRGGAAAPFDPGEVWEDYDFPGKRAPVEGLDEIVRCRPVIRVRAMLTGEYQFTVYRPDGTWADHATIDGARVYTLAALGAALASTQYPRNIIAVWPRMRGDYIAVHFPVGLCRAYNMSSQDRNEGGLDLEIHARIPAGDPITTVPYRIVTYAAGTVAVG